MTNSDGFEQKRMAFYNMLCCIEEVDMDVLTLPEQARWKQLLAMKKQLLDSFEINSEEIYEQVKSKKKYNEFL